MNRSKVLRRKGWRGEISETASQPAWPGSYEEALSHIGISPTGNQIITYLFFLLAKEELNNVLFFIKLWSTRNVYEPWLGNCLEFSQPPGQGKRFLLLNYCTSWRAIYCRSWVTQNFSRNFVYIRQNIDTFETKNSNYYVLQILPVCLRFFGGFLKGLFSHVSVLIIRRSYVIKTE